MSFLRTGSKSTTSAPNYTGLQLQSSVSTLPIPLGWGRFKCAPNVIWYNNFKKHANKQSAGKGLGGGSSTTYTYSADVILGICEGAISGLGQIWKDSTIYKNLSDIGLTLFLGNTPQTVWSYLASKYPDEALTYQGTAFVCAANYDLGSSASLPSHNFEIIGAYAGTGANGVDADPALVANDALTNSQYSPNYPAGNIDTATLFSSDAAATTGDASCQTYWKAVSICFSPVLTSVETAQSVFQRWQKILNIAIFDSGGLLKFIPYGDEAITANGVTYSPNLTPIFDLTDDDFQVDESNDPLSGQITDPFEAYNIERLTISDRANAYNSTIVDARDPAAENNYGRRTDTGVSAAEICDKAVGAICAQLVLQRQLRVRNTYPIKLDARYCGLDPMDIVTATDAALGMLKVPLRIQKIEEDDDDSLTVTVEEMPAGASTATAYPKESSTATGSVTTYSTASAVNPPIIFEPPPALSGGVNQVWIGASGSIGGVADPLWAGADIYISLDDVSYSYIGTIDQPCRQGVLVTDITAASTAMLIDLSQSAGTLSSASSATSAANGGTVSYLDGEVVSFTTATLAGSDQYNLAGVYRAQDNTTAIAHTSGALFARLDAAFFEYDLPAQYIGMTLYVKLASFNAFGAGKQDLSDCVSYQYIPSGSGALGPVASMLALGVGMDYGMITDAVNETDDFGTIYDDINIPVELGATLN